MKKGITLSALLLVSVLIPGVVTAQTATAAPGLSISSSPFANGMGGTAATLPSPDASATIANPGQLGLFSLDNLLSASTFSPRTDLFPGVSLGQLGATMTVSAFNVGYNLTDFLSLPFSLGVGLGYSRTYIDYGMLSITATNGSLLEKISAGNDTYVTYSFGLGLEYVARLGIGLNVRKITSHLPVFSFGNPLSEYTATPSATDFGVLLDIPLHAVLSKVSGTSFPIAGKVDPFLDVSMSYVKSNVGGEVTYVDLSQADPLPRTAGVGLALEGGFSAKAGNAHWRMISLALARQAEEILVNRHPDGSFDYKGGIGDLSIGDNILAGRAAGSIIARKGWQIGAAELFYLRGGSVRTNGDEYSTSGYSLCLAGLIRGIEFFVPETAGIAWLAFIGDRVDLQFHWSSYDSPSSLWGGTTFSELNLLIRGLP